MGSRIPEFNVDISLTLPPITHPAFTDRSPDSLHARVNALADLYYAPTTTDSYRSKIKLYVAFAAYHGLLTRDDSDNVHAPPPTPTLLIYYMAWLQKRGHTTFASIMAYITALCTFCKQKRWPNPRMDELGNPDNRVFWIMRGLKRSMSVGGTATTRYPVTLYHIHHLLLGAMALPQTQRANFKAAILLAFFGLLRVSEFTTDATVDVDRHALRRDIVFLPNIATTTHINFNIKASKCDQFREGVTITIPATHDHSTCPVRALQWLYTTDPQPADHPLFDFRRDGSPNRKTTRSSFTALCNSLFTSQGISSMHLKPHSFRQGGATALVKAGAPPSIIKVIGRWKSDAWLAYCFTDTTEINSWLQRIATAPPTFVDYEVTQPKRAIDY